MPRRQEHTGKLPGSTPGSDFGLILTETPEGVLLPVYAQPGARRNGIIGLHAGRLKIAVTQVAEKGRANTALAELLASELNLNRSQVQLQSGETDRRKTFLIQSLSAAEVKSWLAARPFS